MKTEMYFYYHRENGKVIVQNAIMGMLGQEHEHSEEEFKEWSKDIPEKYLININNQSYTTHCPDGQKGQNNENFPDQISQGNKNTNERKKH